MEVKINKKPTERIPFEDLNIGKTYYDCNNNLCVKISYGNHEDVDWNCMMWNETDKEWELEWEALTAFITPVKSELVVFD